MSSDPLSRAVVVFLGFGTAATPQEDSAAVRREFGEHAAPALEDSVRSLLDELGQIPVHWSIQTWTTVVRTTLGTLGRMVLVLVVALAIVLLAGAGVVAYILRDPPDERPEVVAAVYDAVRQAGNGGTVDFRRLTTFDWDRMYVFGAYTGDDRVSEVLGFPWGTGADFRLPNDGFILLIFAKDAIVTGWAVLNDYQAASAVYFDDSLFETPIARDASVFVLDGDTNTLRSPGPP